MSKVTLVVATALHGEHTDTVAFNPSVLDKCGALRMTDLRNDPRQTVKFQSSKQCNICFHYLLLALRSGGAELGDRCSSLVDVVVEDSWNGKLSCENTWWTVKFAG